jgi:hypothetical protein
VAVGRNYYATEPAFSLTGTQASSNVNAGYLAGAPPGGAWAAGVYLSGCSCGTPPARPFGPTGCCRPHAGAQGNVFSFVQGSKSSAARSEVLSVTGQQQLDFDVGRRRRLAQQLQWRDQARRRL